MVTRDLSNAASNAPSIEAANQTVSRMTRLRTASARILGALVALPVLAGCGLEAHVYDLIAGPNERLVVTLSGKLASSKLDAQDVTLSVATNDGTLLTPCAIGVRGESCIVDTVVENGNYKLVLEKPAGTGYEKLVLGARVGDVNYERYVPVVKDGADKLHLDLTSTLTKRLIEGILSKSGRVLQTLDPATIEGAIDDITSKFDNDAAHEELMALAELLVAASDADASADAPALFQQPALDVAGLVTTSPLNAEWVDAHDFDLDDDGENDDDSSVFDAAFAEAVNATLIEECYDEENLRVVFAVDFNEGNVDENCAVLNRFRWVVDNPGDSMWFVGGIHDDSPIQDTEIDAMLGNSGSWAPNTVPMYDDGSNGDEVAGDNIWTISFILPRGLRMGYKYTWGTQGQLWTGTEEWPGNQRLFEVVDVNGDNVAYRYDNFQDETTNKDRANLNGHNPNPGGVVTWDTDVNGDGIPDPQERPVDENDPPTCNAPEDDVWLTPRGVGPAIVPCE